MSLIDVVWDTIHSQNGGYHWFCNVQNSCTFLKDLPVEKLLAWLQWWFAASSNPQSHICDIFYIFRMHSVKFLNGPTLTFLTNNFTVIQSKFVEMSEPICWNFSLKTWAISIRVHKYGFVLLNRLRIVIHTALSNPRTANYRKNEQKWDFRVSLQIHVAYLCSIDCTQN